jgi:hypothetical protein
MKLRSLALAVLALAASAPSHADPPAASAQSASRVEAMARAARAADLTVGLDFDEARKVLAEGDVDSPVVALERARLALYEADCDGAAAILARPELAASEAGRTLADVSRGCARTTAATVVERDDHRDVVVRYQDESDRALQPLIVETVVRARDRSRAISASPGRSRRASPWCATS